jgi:hypothetical protein
MKSLHTELKETRIAKGITLEDIYRETKIRTAFLERMEEGDFSIVPEPFMRAFLREYAEAVGLDPNRVIAKYEGKPVSVREEPPHGVPNVCNAHVGVPEQQDTQALSVPRPEKTKHIFRRSLFGKSSAKAKPTDREEESASVPPEIPASEGKEAPISPTQSLEPPKTRIMVTIDDAAKPEAEFRKTGPLFPDDEPRNSRAFMLGVFILLIIIATLAILFITGKLSF